VPPQNCERNDKPSYISRCSNPCGPGHQWVVYEIKHPARHGGRPCSAEELAHYRPCNGKDEQDSSNMCKHTYNHYKKREKTCSQYANWSNWSRCDRPCGGGKQYRTRTSHPHLGCPKIQTRKCNTHCCKK
jgi:hypothetical protein